MESICGTYMSSKGMQSITSSGISSMDHILGGGFAINSITLIEEDNLCQFTPLFAKCFVSQSIECKHKTIICSQTISSIRSRFLRELPVRSTQQSKQIDDNCDDLKIAWRYRGQTSGANRTDGKDFDFNSHISEETLTSADIVFCTHDMCLEVIRALNQNDNKTVVRVLIDGLGSALSPISVDSLPKYVYELKSLIRKVPNIVCLATFSPQLVLLSKYSYARSRVHNVVDCVIQLIGFDEWTQTPYTEYNGLFNVLKLPKLNSFNYYNTPETLDLGFQLKNHNRFLVVDKLSLPPDLSETVSRTTGCSTAHNNTQLDF
ncbi:unnamed protein product [Medioppia subpectinata]|uniref:Elongator complex protein 4 n=1 Tax=Medioppia subpectinata TaxID=1979941 RepID=A0A7R9KIT6_9ACAR|nr:unnamed protein product [Medioppia subpectinata]CAG2103114.1 unnamed protein product [Medioppia subpectinata]